MSIYGPRNELDLIAVRKDDLSLDELAIRQVSGPLDDEALTLLAALTADVDAGLAELLSSPLSAPVQVHTPEEVRTIAAAGRRRTARAVTAALIVTSLASVSGVAAAVTGDPLAPYRSVISSVSGGDDTPTPPRGMKTDEAVHQQVLSIEAAIDAGQLGRARAGVARLRSTLDEKPRGAQRAAIAHLAALEARLARAVAKEEKKAEITRGTQRPPAVDQPKPTHKVVVPGQGGGKAKKTKAATGTEGQESRPEGSPTPQATRKNADTARSAPVDDAPKSDDKAAKG
jgi:hypothetical protein